jgi:hypothetical protein
MRVMHVASHSLVLFSVLLACVCCRPKPGHYKDYHTKKPTPQMFDFLLINMNLQSGVRIYLEECETFLAVANAPL